jgi:hypothetical protein
MEEAKQSPVRAPGSRGSSVGPYVVPIDDATLARKNRAAISLLDAWERDEDEGDQKETMAVLRKTLGVNRVASSRNLFP